MEKTEQTEISPFAVQGVLAALKEVQDTVRAYDTKAQIVGVGFIFSIGIITGFGERLPAMADASALLVAVFWIFAIGPVVLFGMVLYPSRSIAPYLEIEANSVRQYLLLQTNGITRVERFRPGSQSLRLAKGDRLRDHETVGPAGVEAASLSPRSLGHRGNLPRGSHHSYLAFIGGIPSALTEWLWRRSQSRLCLHAAGDRLHSAAIGRLSQGSRQVRNELCTREG